MNRRKNLGLRIKDRKQRGIWAELYFIALAAGYGLKILSPYGGMGPYDVGVEDGGPILRVQVKCTLCRCRRGGYSINVNRSYGQKRRRGYAPGTVDFFALYLIPTDDWYIIPYAVIGNRDRNLHFRPECRRQKYDKYKEAWHLLLNAAKGRTDGPIDIHACCNEEGATVEAGLGPDVDTAAGSELAVRTMFRALFST